MFSNKSFFILFLVFVLIFSNIGSNINATVFAVAPPDGIQDFAGYSLTGGVGTSPDVFF